MGSFHTGPTLSAIIAHRVVLQFFFCIITVANLLYTYSAIVVIIVLTANYDCIIITSG